MREKIIAFAAELRASAAAKRGNPETTVEARLEGNLAGFCEAFAEVQSETPDTPSDPSPQPR